MQVQNLMTKQVQSCSPNDTLEIAAQLMWKRDCGCLPVCVPAGDGASRPVGMITDRDICMNALFQGKPLRELRVSDAMAKEVRSCKLSDSLDRAEAIMREIRVRRLPVVDDRGALIGMLSLADLAREAVRERTSSRKEVSETEIGDTLASITEPPPQALVA